MNILRTWVMLILCVTLLGCGKPVPPEKSTYVGEWQATNMYLLITQDGTVRYKRQQEGVSTSVEGPIKDFDGNNFEVGVGPLTTKFIVSQIPYQDGGKWKMVVDGVELTKSME